MKRITLLIITCAYSLLCFAAKNDAIIKGIITNTAVDSVTFSYLSFDGNWLNSEYKTIHVKLDERGGFAVKLPVAHQYTLLHVQNGEQGTETYLSPGDKLEMEANAADFDATLVYKGADASVANFMAKHMLVYGFTGTFHDSLNALMIKEPGEFMKFAEGLVQRQLDFLINNSKELPPSFIHFWNATYTYSKYGSALSYPFLHEIAKKKSYDIGDVPKGNHDVSKQVPAKFDDNYLYILSYRNYASSYYSSQLSALDMDYGNDFNTRVLELARENMPSETKEYMFAYDIALNVKNRTVAKSEAAYYNFRQLFSKSIYEDYLESLIAKKKQLSTGSPAIDFLAFDEDGNKVKISTLKGKVIYIDFWASWCGPCTGEFPHAKKVKEHFEGKDVVFVYVSIDEDVESWKRAKEKHKLTGLHTRIDGESSKLAKDYGVKGIPAYFIIDKNGNFASEQAPRPSSKEKLIRLIENLL